MSAYEIKYTGGTPTKDQRVETYRAALRLAATTLRANDARHAYVLINDSLIVIVDRFADCLDRPEQSIY
jgi:hypothetical protein